MRQVNILAVLCEEGINPFSNDNILDVTKLKAFADDKLNIAKLTISLCDTVENTGNWEKMLVTSIFSFSHSVFQSILL